MIPKIKNILYATDLSENSAYAFRYAVNSAEKHAARIHLLHVLEPLSLRTWPYAYPFRLEKIQEKTKQEFLDEMKKRVEEFCQRELKDKPECLKQVASMQVVEGYPAGTILEKANEAKADMVIMGTHSKGVLAHAFLGSVAESVLNRIKVPVYIIPLPAGGETDPKR
ncbi:MAG: usp-4 [Deltaproteobacteria bacterium]|jgi:nucleotide-binding universal stress UspA family protein|nr:usp-4 [Deltaproteobacteria bacterium]